LQIFIQPVNDRFQPRAIFAQLLSAIGVVPDVRVFQFETNFF
jgi:hypothetical protein